MQPTVLQLSSCDDETAHAALRQMHQLNLQGHEVHVVLTPNQRKHKAFTPWLRDCATVSRTCEQVNNKRQHVMTLKFAAHQRHVHVAKAAHAASFDLRVGGKQCRVLADTGATISCMRASYATALGAPLEAYTAPVTGIGGTVKPHGQVKVAVKAGKQHCTQNFVVIDDQLVGYDVLLGQDYMRANCAGIKFSKTHITFEVGEGSQAAKIARPLDNSVPVAVQRADFVYFMLPDTLGSSTPELDSGVMSKNEYKRALRDIAHGRQIGYNISLVDIDKPAGVGDKPQLDPRIQEVLDRHSKPGGTLCGDVPKGAKTAHGYKMEIKLKSGSTPIVVKQYRLTPAEREELIKQVTDFYQRGWIEPSNSPWSASVLFVPKPNGKLRFCVDYRRLNDVTEKDAGNLPSIPETLDSMQGACVFSALDLCSGYYQIPLDFKSRGYTAFPTPFGLYQWTVTPMGLSNAPAVFQSAINQVLSKHVVGGYCRVYLDDVLVMSKSVEEHVAHLDAVLTSLADGGFYCQMPKCHFQLSELKYLGHIANGAGVKPDPAKVAALDRFIPPLAFVSQLASAQTDAQGKRVQQAIAKSTRSFLGFMNYFARFIPKYADMAACLYDQTQDDAPVWTSACTDAWEALKLCLKRATLMFHPDPSKEYHVYFDASLRGVGGALMQYHDGVLRLVAYYARKLKDSEVKYTTTEQEMLAMYVLVCLALLFRRASYHHAYRS